MQQANSVSTILPVSPAAPMPGNNANSTTASSGSDGQPAFSQVLRDKQMANADAAKAATASSASNSAKANDKADSKAAANEKKADGNDKEVGADKRSGDEVAAETVARTPAELAQLLAAAGLMANAAANQNTASAGETVATEAPITDAAASLATDTSTLTSLPQTDKTAAANTNLAASLAANTANTTTSPEQALTTQSALPGTDNKPGQSGAQSGDQQGTDKQALLAAAANADGEKLRANAAASENSFSAALERAGQSSSTAPAAVNVTPQTQAAPASTHTVTTPVGRQGWADEVGQRVLWTAKSDNSRADLVLTPPQLGRIEVSIQMNGDQANATFMVANAVAREALQDAMPRLRELMSQAGIQLGQADVSAGQSGHSSNQGERRQAGGGGGTGMLGSDAALAGTSSGWTRSGSGMVDTFA